MLRSKPSSSAWIPVSPTGCTRAFGCQWHCVRSMADVFFVGSKLAIATAYLARENVEFVACNTDSTFPAIPGLKLPGAGRFVSLAFDRRKHFYERTHACTALWRQLQQPPDESRR
jgi:hypothetical protein